MAYKTPLVFLAASAVAIAGCTEPNPDHQKARNGAVIGAAIGAASQILAGNSDKSVATGAIVGAAVGAAIGNVLDKQEKELRNEMAGSGATITNTGNELIVTLPEAITFDTDSTFVRASSKRHLATLSQNLQRYPDSTVDVIGHTDNVGDFNYNQNLSSRRAEAVSSVLSNNGVSFSRIRGYGRGETSPIASNETANGRAANRRVEVIIRPTT